LGLKNEKNVRTVPRFCVTLLPIFYALPVMSKPPKQDLSKRCNAQGEKTRRRILITAGRLFAQNGYDSVGIRNVSDEMGVAPSLLIHHFAGDGLG
jgi:AcrR family transcriptional regulator